MADQRQQKKMHKGDNNHPPTNGHPNPPTHPPTYTHTTHTIPQTIKSAQARYACKHTAETATNQRHQRSAAWPSTAPLARPIHPTPPGLALPAPANHPPPPGSEVARTRPPAAAKRPDTLCTRRKQKMRINVTMITNDHDVVKKKYTIGPDFIIPDMEHQKRWCKPLEKKRATDTIEADSCTNICVSKTRTHTHTLQRKRVASLLGSRPRLGGQHRSMKCGEVRAGTAGERQSPGQEGLCDTGLLQLQVQVPVKAGTTIAHHAAPEHQAENTSLSNVGRSKTQSGNHRCICKYMQIYPSGTTHTSLHTTEGEEAAGALQWVLPTRSGQQTCYGRQPLRGALHSPQRCQRPSRRHGGVPQHRIHPECQQILTCRQAREDFIFHSAQLEHSRPSVHL